MIYVFYYFFLLLALHGLVITLFYYICYTKSYSAKCGLLLSYNFSFVVRYTTICFKILFLTKKILGLSLKAEKISRLVFEG